MSLTVNYATRSPKEMPQSNEIREQMRNKEHLSLEKGYNQTGLLQDLDHFRTVGENIRMMGIKTSMYILAHHFHFWPRR